ncbi:MAG: hypothetical protein HFJ12_01725 [Bacilli bacterium]|nr:hypothetical protein [Bacilli bacterium]
MNVIVANERKDSLSNLDIEVIKNIVGEFDSDELVAMFKDFFFDRMILDVTAIKNYRDITNIQKLAVELGEDKLILVLPDEVCSSSNYLSNIISMGIYNFTNNINAIKQLIERPNTYKNVAKIQQLNNMSVEISNRVNKGNKIIGIRNLTDHAGATTLTYILKKELTTIYGNVVYAIEVNKRDFLYFNDRNMFSVSEADLAKKLADLDKPIAVIIDLNDCKIDSMCDEILYLLEPSSIMLNKLIKREKGVFDRLKDKKILLNKSLLSNKEVSELEYEANAKMFYNIPPLDERKKNSVIQELLFRLGLVDNTASRKEEGNKIFGLFGRH